MDNNIFRLRLPGNIPVIEESMDRLIQDTELVLSDPGHLRRLGIYIKPLKDHNLVGVYRCDSLGESIVRLKAKPLGKRNLVGRSIEYDFEIPVKIMDIPKISIL